MVSTIWELVSVVASTCLMMWFAYQCIAEEWRGHEQMSVLFLLVVLVMGTRHRK